jgi:hypothetical protein
MFNAGAGGWQSLKQYLFTCFTGRMLLDVEGGKKRADRVAVGDLLWARDENDPNGPLALKRVLRRFVRVASILELKVGGQVIETTAEHPFYVQGRAWLPAGALKRGDLLRTREGAWVAVEGVADTGRVETVYNFEIEDYHTYFVSADESGFSVWAHNADYTAQSRRHVSTHGHAAHNPRQPAPLPGQPDIKSKFKPREGGQKFTDEVIGHPSVVVTHQANGRIRYDVVDLGRTTGRNNRGNLTRGGTVVVEGPTPASWSTYATDEVVTQFPL